jgi:thiamine biosynthesis protein ThiS
VKVRVNGSEVDLAPGATVAEAVVRLGVAEGERGVAAALDGEVVAQADWGRTPLREGASVEVVRAAAGG